MAAPYRRNKLKTFCDIVRRIENWPTAADMRLRQKRKGLRMLSFRDGLNLICRAGSRDWDVVHELLFAGSYQRALDHVRNARGPVTVLDLGGNIGLFSLMVARQREDVTVHAYEPGPPNFRLFEMNRLANPLTSERIQLHREAVADANTTVNWFFDEANPGGSSLYGTNGKSFPVTIRAFGEVVEEIAGPITLAKIDIEGAEYDLLRGAPTAAWEKISAIALELHDDPAKKLSQSQFLESMKELGYAVEEESVCSYFLHR